MTVQHVADPARGAQEAEINAGLERDGIDQRICLHPDRTIRTVKDGTVVECDYCPAMRAAGPGLPAELPAWYWRVGVFKEGR